MKYIYHIFIFAISLLALINTRAQNIDSSKIKLLEKEQFEIAKGNYYIDNSDYIYVVNADEILKYSSAGELLFRYSNLALGEIATLDVSNPMKVLVFYKLNSQLVILDNTLTQRGETIQLEDKNLYQATAVGYNYLDNGIWVFDQSLFRLVRLNENYEISYESGNLAELLHISDLSVIEIRIKHQNIYLRTEKNGLLVFDIYGTFFKKIPLFEFDDFQIDKEFIFYLKDNHYYAYSLLDFESTEVKLPIQPLNFVWNSESTITTIDTGKVVKFSIVEK